MQQAQAAEEHVDDGRFFMRVFYVFFALAVLSLAITVAGKWFGRTIVMAGNTDATTQYHITIGNEALAFPANMIRFRSERLNGATDKIDLYARWPDMQGYSLSARRDFDNRSGRRRILFLTISPRIMSRDMSGRFEPIYKNLIESPGTAGPAGLTFYRFSRKSGYLDEELAVAERPGRGTPYVARCLDGKRSGVVFADCERDIQFGHDLQLRYRFPRDLIGDWAAMDRRVTAFATNHLVTGN